MSRTIKKLSFDRALKKALNYCSYQERCRADLEAKFIYWGVIERDRKTIMKILSEEDYYNEGRFVKAYISGKFRIKKWGRNKIIIGLSKLQLRGEQVSKAIHEEIGEEEYYQALKVLIDKKKAQIKEEDVIRKKEKVYRYMVNKGYESNLVLKELSKG